MIILLKLFLAHLLGDFILQPGSWVIEKEDKKLKTPKLYLHAFIHGALALLFVWDMSFIWMAAIIAVSHFIIDAIKLHFQKRKMNRYGLQLTSCCTLL